MSNYWAGASDRLGSNIGSGVDKLKNMGKSTVDQFKDALGIPEKNTPNAPIYADWRTDKYLDFINFKSILTTYNFLVIFPISELWSRVTPHHVKSVSIPNYKLGIRATNYGPVAKGYTHLNKEDILQLSITFEDDYNATILKLGYDLYRTIVTKDGYYTPLSQRNLGEIEIFLLSKKFDSVLVWRCEGVYFAGLDDTINLSYESSKSLEVTMRFGCDAIIPSAFDWQALQDIKSIPPSAPNTKDNVFRKFKPNLKDNIAF